MPEIKIQCRSVVKGKAAGIALISKENIGCFGSLDETTGIVTERGHCIFGQCIKDTVFAFPAAKGSSGWSGTFHMLKVNGVSPKAMMIGKIDAKSALGSVLCGCPTVSDFETDPFCLMETGDYIEVNADDGYIIIHKKEGI